MLQCYLKIASIMSIVNISDIKCFYLVIYKESNNLVNFKNKESEFIIETINLLLFCLTNLQMINKRN